MIRIEHLSFAYARGMFVLDDINIEFPAEHILAILGESGSGKTTLLRCIGRFLKPKAGRISIQGRNIQSLKEIELRKAIGIVFQKLYLFPHLTALENLILAPTQVLKLDESDTKTEAESIMQRLGIHDLMNSYPAQMSGGQAQRVAIARSLMLKPEYLLLDEPTSALDIKTTTEFAEWLLELKTETTFIVVTHDIPFARNVASSGVLLSDGKVAAKGKIEDIVEYP